MTFQELCEKYDLKTMASMNDKNKQFYADIQTLARTASKENYKAGFVDALDEYHCWRESILDRKFGDE